MVTQERLKEILDYDPETGIFTWRETRGNRARGSQAGNLCRTNGYVGIGVDGKLLKAHRLAWLWMTGTFPAGDIDHKDLCRSNNRWENLREATKITNGANRGLERHNTSGVKGVSWHAKSNKWQAQMVHSKKTYFLGYHADISMAALAVRLKREELCGVFTNHG